MSKPKKTEKVMLLIGIIYKKEYTIKNICDLLEKRYGDIHSVYLPIDFAWTDYYKSEMGEDLKRSWIAFNYLIYPDDVIGIKWKAFEIENEYLNKNGERMINIDIGYIALPRLVLSTFKDFSHRIYLGKHVYAEVTLIYQKKMGWKTLPWTYIDYADEKARSYFDDLRKALIAKHRMSSNE